MLAQVREAVANLPVSLEFSTMLQTNGRTADRSLHVTAAENLQPIMTAVANYLEGIGAGQQAAATLTLARVLRPMQFVRPNCAALLSIAAQAYSGSAAVC